MGEAFWLPHPCRTQDADARASQTNLFFLFLDPVQCTVLSPSLMWFDTARPFQVFFFIFLLILGSDDNKVMVSLKIKWDMVAVYISILSFSEIMGHEMAPTRILKKCKWFQPLGTINKQYLHKGCWSLILRCRHWRHPQSSFGVWVLFFCSY